MVDILDKLNICCNMFVLQSGQHESLLKQLSILFFFIHAAFCKEEKTVSLLSVMVVEVVGCSQSSRNTLNVVASNSWIRTAQTTVANKTSVRSEGELTAQVAFLCQRNA